MMRVLSLLGASLCIGAFGGCSGLDDLNRPSFTVADSAGIEVVSSHAPAWSADEVWRVSDRPIVTIGQFDGPAELTFGRVRAAGWLPDGRIFVGDDHSHSIRMFSPQGDHLATVGREGHGPGELQWFLTVSPYRRDSLFVYDIAQRAVSVFAPDLTFVRRFTNPTGEGNYRIVGALDNGRFLLGSPGHNGLSGGPGLVPDTSLIIVSAQNGFSTDTVGAFETTVQHVGSNRRNQALFLQPHGALVADGNRIIWTEGRTFEYVESDPYGAVRRIARTTHRPIPVTEGIISDFKVRYMEWLEVALVEGTMDEARQSLEGGEYYPRLPATSDDVKIDALGNVWLGHYHHPGRPTERWAVFDVVGVWQGTVGTPSGFEVHEIGVDQVIGVGKDAYDVPYIQVHRLDRGQNKEPRG